MVKILLCRVDVDELQVGAQHPESLGARRVAGDVGDQGDFRRLRVPGDVAHHGGVRHGDDVVGRLQCRVEQLAEHGDAEAQQQSEHRGKTQVAQRLRGEGSGRQRSVLGDRGLDRRRAAALGRLVLADDPCHGLGVALGQRLRHLRVGIGHADLEVDRLRHDGGGNLLSELGGVRSTVDVREAPASATARLPDQIGVGRDALLGEESAQRRPGSHPCWVWRRRACAVEEYCGTARKVSERGDADAGEETGGDEQPATARNAQVVTDFHVVLSPVGGACVQP